MNHHHQEEQEITEKNFVETIRRYDYSDEDAGKYSFKLAQSYHKQQLSKALAEEARELPTEDDARYEFNINEGNERNSMGFKSYLWMRNKAAEVIAVLKDEIEKLDQERDELRQGQQGLFQYQQKLLKELSEKDKLLVDRDEEIWKLKNAKQKWDDLPYAKND